MNMHARCERVAALTNRASQTACVMLFIDEDGVIALATHYQMCTWHNRVLSSSIKLFDVALLTAILYHSIIYR